MAILGSTDLGDGRYALNVDHDPTSVATDCLIGSMIIYNGLWYRKLDDGSTTNVILMASLFSGFLTSGYIGDGAVVSGSIAPGQISSSHFSSGTILPNQITSGGITSGMLGDGAVVSGSIASGSIGLEHLASGVILPTSLASGMVQSGHLGDGSVVSGSIASGQVGTFHLASGAVLASGVVVEASGFIGWLGSGDFTTQQALATLDRVGNTTAEPMGFPNFTDSEFFMSGESYTIQPASGKPSFDVWVKGRRYVFSGAQTLDVSGQLSDGSEFFYFASGGVLTHDTNFWDLEQVAPATYALWNVASGSADYLGEERHGVSMPWADHKYGHLYIGTRYGNGLTLTGNVAGNGNVDSHAQVAITEGLAADEDIDINVTSGLSSGRFNQKINPIAGIPVFFRLGANGPWRKKPANDFPVYENPADEISYNLDTAGTWSLPPASIGNYVAVWLFATTNFYEPIVAVLGQRQDGTLANAQANNLYESLAFGDFPFSEGKILYRLIFQTSTAYGNSVRARLRHIQDLRSVSNLPAGTYTATAHNSLTGLSTYPAHPAEALSIATTAWSGTLAAASGTVQAALDIIDQIQIQSANIASGQIGSAHFASGTLLPNQITSGGITSGMLGDGAVVSGSIASGQVGIYHLASGIPVTSGMITSGDLGNDAVLSANIASGQVGATHLASGIIIGSITSGAIQSGDLGVGVVVSSSIASGQIGNAHLANGSVLSAHIASGQVSSAHFASGTILPPSSGSITSGMLGDGSVVSGSLASGMAMPWDNVTGTGIQWGGIITINGGDNTTFDVSAGAGYVVDNHTNPAAPVVKYVTWSAFTAQAATYLATAEQTQIGIDVNGAIVQKASVPFTPAESRDYIILGKIIHNAMTVIERTRTAPRVAYNAALDADDMSYALGPITVNGVVITPNGANMFLNRTSGTMHGLGIGYLSGYKTPNFVDLRLNSGFGFFYRYQNGSGGFVSTPIRSGVDPAYYDNGTGTLALVTSGSYFTNQRVYVFPTGINYLTYGQAVYPSVATALRGLATENPVIDPNLEFDAALRGVVIVRQNAVNLSNVNQAEFVNIGKINEIPPGAGAAGSLDSGQVASGNIGDGAVVSGSIASGQIASPHLADGAVLSANIGSGQIGIDHLASGVMFALSSGIITSGYIGDGAVVSGSIASGHVGHSHISSGGVTSAHYASGSIQAHKLASGTLHAISGHVTILSGDAVGLTAGRFILGTDLSILPVVGNQSLLSTWWAMQLRGNQQTDVSGTLPTQVGPSPSWATVIIPNGQAGSVGLAVVAKSGQTGDLFEVTSPAASGVTPTVLARINSSGKYGGGFLSGTIQSGALGDGVVVSSSIASGQIGIDHLASGVIPAGSLSSGSVGSGYLGDGAVVSGSIASGQISSAHFSSGTILPNQITSGGITSGMLGDGSVVSGSIASGQVGSVHLASGTVLPRNTVRVTNETELDAAITYLNTLGGGLIIIAGVVTLTGNKSWDMTGITVVADRTASTAFDFSTYTVTIQGGSIFNNIRFVGDVSGAGNTRAFFIYNIQLAQSFARFDGCIFKNMACQNSSATGVVQVTASASGRGISVMFTNCDCHTDGTSSIDGFSVENLTADTSYIDVAVFAWVRPSLGTFVGCDRWFMIGTALTTNNAKFWTDGTADVQHTGLYSSLSSVGVSIGRSFIEERTEKAYATPADYLLVEDMLYSGNLAKVPISGFFASGGIRSDMIGSGQVTSGSMGDASVVSGSIASGQVGYYHVASGMYVTSGTITSGDLGNATVVSGSIASGQVWTTHLAADSITSAIIASGQVGQAIISSGGVTSAHYASGSISTFKIAASAVVSSLIASGQVGQAIISSGGVTSAHYASGSISYFKIASGQVQAQTIASGAVTSGKIASGSIGINHMGAASVASSAIASGAIAFAVPSFSGQPGGTTEGLITVDPYNGRIWVYASGGWRYATLT